MPWKVFLLIIVSLSLLVLVACSSRRDSADTPATATAEPEAMTATATSQPTPARSSETRSVQPGGNIDGGTLVRLGGDPPTLDPHLTTDATSATYIVEVFGGLVTIDSELNIVPDIARNWDISPDGRIYTFYLREDAQFHSGKPVTAQDFKWSLERATDPLTAAPVVDEYLGDIVGADDKLEGNVRDVSGIRVIDDYTLEITIDEPKSYFLAKLTYPTGFVLDQENVESDRRWFRTPNGTGPFKLEEYVPGETMILARNENYHLGSSIPGKGRVHP